MMQTTEPKSSDARLQSRRLILRMPNLDDAFAINEIYNEGDVARWMSVPSPCPIGFTLEQFQRLVVPSPNGVCYIILRKNQRPAKPIGMILANWAGPTGVLKIGFLLTEKHHRKGLMREALNLILPQLFKTARTETVEASRFEGNEASDKLMLKMGFRQVGTSTAFNRATRREEPQVDYVLARSDLVVS
ncbi:GNAT family N-acetyltransferase [Roseibium sp. CAU 1637]|uniref:GNAT family N-acetyltransferase n=1 Tax=Roseibium limicola TaxID=2816037 RepID=A0A939EQH6_9HYPH|nr:GNAT family protein [Roseibium limicola]MBO0346814.1 GNAT family N-acetyltransferase [Roseibium limicola]